nr:MAG TPA: hypothetical protein [Inoviridae sp.]
MIMITKKYSDTLLQKGSFMLILFVPVFRNQKKDMDMNAIFSIIK